MLQAYVGGPYVDDFMKGEEVVVSLAQGIAGERLIGTTVMVGTGNEGSHEAIVQEIGPGNMLKVVKSVVDANRVKPRFIGQLDVMSEMAHRDSPNIRCSNNLLACDSDDRGGIVRIGIDREMLLNLLASPDDYLVGFYVVQKEEFETVFNELKNKEV